MAKYLEKIQKNISKLKGGQREIAKKIGVSNTTIYNIFQNKEIKLVTLLDVCEGLNFSKKEILKVYEEWSLERVGKYLDIDKSINDFTLLEKSNLRLKELEKSQALGKLKNKIPIYSSVSAGVGCTPDAEPVEWLSMDGKPNNWKGIIVNGKSMEPTICDKSTVFFKEEEEVRDGDIGIFILEGEGFIKRIYRNENSVILESDNRGYPPILVHEYSDFKICGKVVKVLSDV